MICRFLFPEQWIACSVPENWAGSWYNFCEYWEFKDFVKALQSSQEKSVLTQNMMDFMLNKMVKEEGAGEWKMS